MFMVYCCGCWFFGEDAEAGRQILGRIGVCLGILDDEYTLHKHKLGRRRAFQDAYLVP